VNGNFFRPRPLPRPSFLHPKLYQFRGQIVQWILLLFDLSLIATVDEPTSSRLFVRSGRSSFPSLLSCPTVLPFIVSNSLTSYFSNYLHFDLLTLGYLFLFRCSTSLFPRNVSSPSFPLLLFADVPPSLQPLIHVIFLDAKVARQETSRPPRDEAAALQRRGRRRRVRKVATSVCCFVQEV